VTINPEEVQLPVEHNVQPKTIDLTPYLAPGRRVILGRDKGKVARLAEGLDEMDNDTPIIIHTPEHVMSVNLSFLFGLLEGVGYRRGYQKFIDTVSWTGKDLSLPLLAVAQDSRSPEWARQS